VKADALQKDSTWPIW